MNHLSEVRWSCAYLLLIVAAFITGPVPGADAASPPPAVIVAEAQLKSLVDRVEALGTLRANESVSLTASVTETVTGIYFDDGQRIKADAILVEMTSTEEHAQLEESQATVAEAKRQFKRVQSLAAQGTASRSLLDERRRDWETARARLAAIESRLADRLLKAPFSGVVGLRNLSLGALVRPGDLITTLDDDRVMKLEFSVPSIFLETLRSGLPITAKARAYGDREFVGRVVSIDSRVDPVTRSILVRAALPNDDRALKPGLLMRVELLKNPREGLMIPETALTPLGEQQYVLVVNEADDLQVERREVKIGARQPGEVEVVAGLKPGEKVITHGVQIARPGQNVKILAVDDGSHNLRAILRKPVKGGPQP